MAHGLNPIIKREINNCGNSNSLSVFNKSSTTTTTTSLVGNSAATMAAAQPSSGIQSCSASNSSNTSHNDGNGNNSNAGASGNTRMGSRRIFAPQFKLQVLESYRNDSDCKGNQRATARKYLIHRRQIQKWLQCENNLRSSVANLNQNNVKHQFHNISHTHANSASSINQPPSQHHPPPPPHHHLHQQQHPSGQPGQRHQQQSQPQHPSYKNLGAAALDPARHSVAQISSTTCSPPTSTVRLVQQVMAAAPKCMNGGDVDSKLPLIQPSAVTNTISLHRPYSQTPVVQAMPTLIHQHHHYLGLGNGSGPQHHLHHHRHQHDSVLMPSPCLGLPVLPISVASFAALESRDYQPITAAAIASTGNSYMTTESSFNKSSRLVATQSIYDRVQHYNSSATVAPIDLSVGPKRLDLVGETISRHDSETTEWRETNNNDQKLSIKVEFQPPASPSIAQEAVDLRCRKRTNYSTDETTPPEKLQKTDNDAAEAAKPVKLFKPYLLDQETANEEVVKKPAATDDQKDAIIWSNYPTVSLQSSRYEMHSTHSSNFQSPSSDPAYTFPVVGSPVGSANRFQSERITPPIATSTATTLLWCPKGSPVSGYDTASTYSDSSEYNAQHCHQYAAAVKSPICDSRAGGVTGSTYSLDLKMRAIVDSHYYDLTTCRGISQATTAILAENYNSQPRSEVQRWLLGHEDNLRPLALYV